MIDMIRSVCVAIWTTIAPPPLSTEAPDVAQVIAQVIAEDASQRGPVLSTHLEDAATMAVFAFRESRLHRFPRPESWDAVAEVSCGVWQLPCAFVRSHSLLDQGRQWLVLLRGGALLCPQSPASPLSGEGCRTGGVGARRVAEARQRLSVVTAEIAVP